MHFRYPIFIRLLADALICEFYFTCAFVTELGCSLKKFNKITLELISFSLIAKLIRSFVV